MPNPVVHFEIGCRDSEKAREFYGKLFEWDFTAAGPATMIDTKAGVGINGHITALGHEPHHYVTFYVNVDDLQAYLDRAEQLGGKTMILPTEIPGGIGSFAWMQDPDGNVIGLFKPGA